MEEALAAFESAFPKSSVRGSILPFRRGREPSGQSVFLLPGASGTSEFFSIAARYLPQGLDPIFVDYPGTPPPQTLAAELGRLAEALDVRASVAVGCSYSAWWLQHIAAAPPGRIGKLILCNGFVEAEDLKPNPLFDHDKIAATEADELRREWAQRAAASAGSPLGDLLTGAMTGWLAAEDLKGRLLQVSASEAIAATPAFEGEIAVLDCDDDPIVGPEARANFRARFPDAAKVTMESGGHYPYVLAPQEFSKKLLDLI